MSAKPTERDVKLTIRMIEHLKRFVLILRYGCQVEREMAALIAADREEHGHDVVSEQWKDVAEAKMIENKRLRDALNLIIDSDWEWRTYAIDIARAALRGDDQ